MLGAPPGFIPINGDIVNAKSVDSVCKVYPEYFSHTYSANLRNNFANGIGVDFDKETICVECLGVKWFLNMSVQQFAARIVEAMFEIQSTEK